MYLKKTLQKGRHMFYVIGFNRQRLLDMVIAIEKCNKASDWFYPKGTHFQGLRKQIRYSIFRRMISDNITDTGCRNCSDVSL